MHPTHECASHLKQLPASARTCHRASSCSLCRASSRRATTSHAARVWSGLGTQSRTACMHA